MPFHRMTPASRCSGGGSDGHLEARRTAVSIDHVDVQVGLHVHVRRGVDPTEKPERLVVAADEHVLPVVDALAGRRIGEGGRPAAQRRPCFENQDAHTALGQCGRGAQAGKAPSDDDDVTRQW